MMNLYKPGLPAGIVLALYILSIGTAHAKVKSCHRENSSGNLNSVTTTVQTPEVCGGINFTSQAQVDAFPSTYDCSEITGDLSISGADITNLDSLARLRSISGALTISYNTNLINLCGLRGITSVGMLEIRANPALTNLNGLQGLTTLTSDLVIVDNTNLINLDGLSSLSSAGAIFFVSNAFTNIGSLSSLHTVTGVVTLRFNNQLTNLDGFIGLTSTPGLEINGNNSLADLTGLAALDSVNGDFTINSNTALTTLNGLLSLRKVRNLTINGNPVLSNLEGLSTLQTIDGNLIVSGNPQLSSLEGLTSVSTVQGVEISNNAALTSLQGLSSLNTISLPGNLNISQNPSLTRIDFQRLTVLSGSLTIADNTSVTSLQSLSTLQTIGGTLTVSNDAIENLDSLHSLTRVGMDLVISNNPNLTNIAGLSQLTYVGAGGGPNPGAHINGNPKLTSLDGLNMLASITGMLEISNNGALTNVDGLSLLASVGALFPSYNTLTIVNNPVLSSLKGLRSITALHGIISISNNFSLPNLDGLESLTRIASVQGENTFLAITDNASLANIDGLSALTEVSGHYTGVTISNNPALLNVNGLSSLRQIDGGPTASLEISNNTSLPNVNGLSSIGISGGFTYLTVTNNPQLTLGCGLYNILNVMTGTSCYCNPYISISGNGAGCVKDDILAGGPCCTSSGGCTPPEPASQPTNLTFSNITCTSTSVSFIAPSPSPGGYIALMRTSSSPYPDNVPVDGTVYHVGDTIGSSTVVAFGNGTSFDATNLSSSTAYYFDVFSHNSYNYLTVNPLAGHQRTADPSSATSAQPTGLIFSAVTDTTMTVSFTPARQVPNGYITLMQAFGSPYPDDAPVDGTTYVPGNIIGSSTIVINMGNETTVDVTYLTPGVEYFFNVFSYTIANGVYDYLTTNPLEGAESTTSSRSASARIASGQTQTSHNQYAEHPTDNNSFNPFPNPFSDSITIPFATNTENTFVQVVIYDLMGRRIADVVSQSFNQGYHEAKWEGKDTSGNKVMQGIYVYSIRTNESDREVVGKLLSK